MSFLDLINKRQSTRSYLDKEVDRELLEEIAQAARLQPSAVNSQQYRLHICTGESARRIAKARGPYNKFIDNVPAFIVITEKRSNLLLKTSSKVIDKDFLGIDIGIVTAAICYRALELGISSCILGLFKEKEVQEIIGDKNKVAIIVALGYPDNDNLRPKKRLDIDKFRFYHD